VCARTHPSSVKRWWRGGEAHTAPVTQALPPWRVFLGCPACIQPVFRLYLTVTVILGIPLYPCIYLHLAISQQIARYPAVSHCIQLYPYVSSCIQLYPAAGISPHPTASKTGYGQKYTPGEGSHLAFTRYCHCQYCMVYGMYKGGRVGAVYCALVVQ